MAKKDKTGKAARAQDFEARLARLEMALAGLGAAPAPAEALSGAPGGAGNGILRIALRGAEGLADWRHEMPAGAVLAADWTGLAARLAALGHPARLAILRAALAGPVATGALMAAAGTTTAGQFYHHLRELTAAGWLSPEGRGRYGVPPARAAAVVAVVALAMAA